MSPDDPKIENETTEDSGNGLSAEEQAIFEQMAKGEAAEIDDGGNPPEPEKPATPPAPPPQPGAPPAPAPAAAKAPDAPAAKKPGEAEKPAADGDDDDEVDAAAAPGPDGKQPPRRVNYNKFKREQDARAQAETDLKTERETRIRLEERTKLLLNAIETPAVEAGKPKEPDDPAPDPEADIFAYVRWQGRQMERLNAKLAETQQTTTQHVEHQNIQQDYSADARQFAAQEPTFPLAYTALITSRARELHRVGYSAEDIKKTVESEERGIVQYARSVGKSPAQVIFEIAQDRGFNVEAARAQLTAPPAPAAGAAPAPAPAAPQKPTASAAQPGAPAAPATVSEEIQRIANGSESALSLSAIPGMPNTQLTPEMIANMPEDEFGELLESLTPAQKRAMLGG